jgi:hypothetical protein
VFYQDSLLNQVCPDQQGAGIYFVDNFCVSLDSNSCVPINQIEEYSNGIITFKYFNEGITIHFSDKDEITSLTIYNSIGQITYTLTVKNDEFISLAALSSGIYYLNFSNTTFRIFKN